MFTVERPSWAIRVAKLLSPNCAVVLIRYNADFEAVELVHPSGVTSRDLLEAAQLSIVKVLERVR